MTNKPCNVSKCPEPNKNTGLGFFDRTRNIIVFFIVLGVIAMVLTITTVSIREEFGDVVSVGAVYWDFNVFFTYLIGFVVTPIVILYVVEKRKKTLRY